MSREEAIEILTGVNIVDTTTYLEALGVATAALIGSAQHAPAKLDRSQWNVKNLRNLRIGGEENAQRR